MVALFYIIKETVGKGHGTMFCAQRKEKDPNDILNIYILPYFLGIPLISAKTHLKMIRENSIIVKLKNRNPLNITVHNLKLF